MTEKEKNLESTLDVIRVTEFRAGEALFRSDGIVRVRVTKQGTPKVLELQIRSLGMGDLRGRDEPRPPAKRERVDHRSEDGRAMRLTEPTWVLMPNYTDKEYLKAREAFDEETTFDTIAQALVGTFTDEGGRPVTDRDGKLNVLKDMGLTGHQFAEIVAAIGRLTAWSEQERISFLSGSSDGVGRSTA